jgi:hypothetical protein
MRWSWTSIAFGTTLVALAILINGCGKSTTAPNPPQSSDAAEVASTLVAAATLVDDGLAVDSTQVNAERLSPAPGIASIQAAIRPFTWWQRITGVARTWSFAWSDTDATAHPKFCVATLTEHLTGTLVIVPASPSDSTRADTTRILKPIDKTLTRKVMLQRLALGLDREWRVIAVTGALVTTPGAITRIVSLRIRSASGVDTTLTDPLQWMSLRHIIQFGVNDSVTVTVTTVRADNPVYIHRWDWRHRLRNNLDDTYSFTWVTSAWSGFRHFGIQAMSHGSIYDDKLPFDMMAWHLPFRVTQTGVDYYP